LTGQHSWRRWKAVGLILAVAGIAVAGLTASTAAGKAKDVTLTVSLFGNFGYHDLYKQFEAAHPGVTIKEDIQQYPQHHSDLAKYLATGSGADDVEAIDVGFIPQFKAQPDKFYDLNQFGASKIKNQWLPWKWAQSLASNGAQIGLGTDVGGLAICYRWDLFKKAGLPTNRDAVSKLWPTWQAFFAAGKRFQAQAPAGVKFFDAGTNVFNAMVAQVNPAYYDASGKIILGSNPKLKAAWDLLMSKGVAGGMDSGLTAFAADWNTGFQKGTFASVTCPAWMMGYIQGQAPKTKGLWDVAAVPGGGGNWGGSFLTIPKQSKNAEMAFELIKFLTSPASEAYIFKQTGNLPSEPSLYRNAAIIGFKNPFFHNAPVGKVFTTAALKLKPQSTGPHHGDIQDIAVANAIHRVEQKKQTPDQSWKQLLKDVKQYES
jgi:cellobiose transport system substrate-binding protein